MEVSNESIYCMFETNPDMAECLPYDPEIAERFLEHPVFDAEGRLPFQFETLAEYQAKRKELLALPEVYPDRFTQVQFN